MRRYLPLLLLAITVAGASGSAGAGTWSVNVENDRIANTDRHYTNGFRLGWVSDETDGSELPEVRDVLQFLYPLADIRSGRMGFELGHNIFTPENTQSRSLEAADRPYAGWLYGSASLYAETKRSSDAVPMDRLDKVALELGVVGPAALGEQVQNEFHKLIGVAEAEGWDNQLDNEPGINLVAERKWRPSPINVFGFDTDIIPHVGGSLGNVYTHLNGGAVARLGQNLSIDYGPPMIRPSVTGFGALDASDGLSWYGFMGIDGRWVLRNIFLDGNTFASSHDVDRKKFVADFVAGVTVVYGGARIAFTHVMRTREFLGQSESDRFGAVSLSFRF